MWTYLNTPFLYTYEGFITEETPSIQVEGETCFGPDGLLRRHDYKVDILGGATGLN